MKYLFIIAALLFQIHIAAAQAIQIPVGSKFKCTTAIDNLVEISVMDQHMQMHSDGAIQFLYEVLNVNTNGYNLQVTPKHMSMNLMVNGRDQKIDTDSATDKNNPLYAKLFELMNKPQAIEVKDNKVIKNALLSEFNQSGLQDDPNKFFLTPSATQMHLGFQWKDSSMNENTKVVNQYIIIQISDSSVNVNVSSDFTIHNKVEQPGLTIDQNLKGYSTGNRIYRKQNNLLKEETMDYTISGSAESNDMSSPVTMKMKIKSTVEM